MTTTDVAQVLDAIARLTRRMDASDAASEARHDRTDRRLDEIGAKLVQLDADLAGVLTREQESRMRSTIEAEVRARYGLDDEPTDTGIRPSPLASGLPHRSTSGARVSVPPMGEDPLDGILGQVRENFRFSVIALLIAMAIGFGGVPQVVAALQSLGYLPAAPVAVQLDPVEPSPLSRPSPFGDEVSP